MRQNRRFLRWVVGSFLAGLIGFGTAHAQSMGGGSSGGGSLGGGGIGGGGIGGGSLGGGGIGGGLGGGGIGGGLGSSGGIGGGLGSSGGIGGGISGNRLGGGNNTRTGTSGSTFGGQGGRGGTGTSVAIPSTSNPFAANYYSPLTSVFNSGALPGALTASFGQARFTTRATTTGAGLGSSVGGARGNAGTGFTTVGTRRTPHYSTALSEDLPMVAHAPVAVVGNVSGALQRSRFLSSSPGIRVTIDGGTVVLRGQVASAKERRIAEGIVRLTPGVREVRNELAIVENGPSPRPVAAVRP